MATFEEWKELYDRKREIFRERRRISSFQEEFSTAGCIGDGSVSGVIDGLMKTRSYVTNNNVWEGADREAFLNLVGEIKEEIISARSEFINRLNRWEASLLEEEKEIAARIQKCQAELSTEDQVRMYRYAKQHGA